MADTGNNEIRAGAGATQRLEMEGLVVQAKSAVDQGVFSDANMSGGAGRFFNATAVGDFVTYTVPIAQPGSYRLKVAVKTRNNKGIFQLSIDGVNQGMPQDLYSPIIGYSVRDLGIVTFTTAGDKIF